MSGTEPDGTPRLAKSRWPDLRVAEVQSLLTDANNAAALRAAMLALVDAAIEHDDGEDAVLGGAIDGAYDALFGPGWRQDPPAADAGEAP